MKKGAAGMGRTLLFGWFAALLLLLGAGKATVQAPPISQTMPILLGATPPLCSSQRGLSREEKEGGAPQRAQQISIP
jgi:hypothetical protein